MRRLNIIIFILATLTSCFDPREYELEALDVDEIVRLENADQVYQILADGSATITITASLSEESVDGKRMIEFSTTKGSFIGGEGNSISKEATVSESGDRYEASVTLKSTTNVETAKVTAVAAGVKAQEVIQVDFTKAFPTSFVVRVDSASLKPTFQDEMEIKAILIRSNGTPSSKHSVSFSVIGEDDREVGFYVNDIKSSTSNAVGIATIRYTIGSDFVNTNEVLRIIGTTEIVQGNDTVIANSQTQFIVDN